MADWQEDSNAHCRENDANALCATCGKMWAAHIGRCCDGDESSERRFKLAAPAQNVRDLIEQLCSAAVAYGECADGEQAYYAAKAKLIEAACGVATGDEWVRPDNTCPRCKQPAANLFRNTLPGDELDTTHCGCLYGNAGVQGTSGDQPASPADQAIYKGMADRYQRERAPGVEGECGYMASLVPPAPPGQCKHLSECTSQRECFGPAPGCRRARGAKGLGDAQG